MQRLFRMAAIVAVAIAAYAQQSFAEDNSASRVFPGTTWDTWEKPGGYNIRNIAGSVEPAVPEREHRMWYQYYFHTKCGGAGSPRTATPLQAFLAAVAGRSTTRPTSAPRRRSTTPTSSTVHNGPPVRQVRQSLHQNSSVAAVFRRISFVLTRLF